MLSSLRPLVRWLLLLCFIGQGFAPFVTMANTRVGSSEMTICYSGQTSSEEHATHTHHRQCCCHLQHDATLTNTPSAHIQGINWLHRTTSPRLTQRIPRDHVAVLHARGPPDEMRRHIRVNPMTSLNRL